MVICVHNVTNKILSQDSNYIVDMVMLQKIGNSSSSNLNEVIKAVLNFFFYNNILHAPKAPKAPKAQRRNQAKVQNATSEQK